MARRRRAEPARSLLHGGHPEAGGIRLLARFLHDSAQIFTANPPYQTIFLHFIIVVYIRVNLHI
jgi:hypothetical protein